MGNEMRRPRENESLCRRRDAGFTLAETLLAVLIMSIIFTAVGGGVIVLKNNYEKVTQRAQAQVLLATTVSAMNADLESATAVKLDEPDKTKVSCFYSSYRNTWCKFETETSGSSGGVSSIQLVITDASGTQISGSTDEGSGVMTNASVVTDAASTKMNLSTNLLNELAELQFIGDPTTNPYAYFQYTVEVRDKGGRLIETKTIKVSPISSPVLR